MPPHHLGGAQRQASDKPHGASAVAVRLGDASLGVVSRAPWSRRRTPWGQRAYQLRVLSSAPDTPVAGSSFPAVMGTEARASSQAAEWPLTLDQGRPL